MGVGGTAEMSRTSTCRQCAVDDSGRILGHCNQIMRFSVPTGGNTAHHCNLDGNDGRGKERRPSLRSNGLTNFNAEAIMICNVGNLAAFNESCLLRFGASEKGRKGQECYEVGWCIIRVKPMFTVASDLTCSAWRSSIVWGSLLC